MNEHQHSTTHPQESKPVQVTSQDQTARPVPIEVKWNLPAWMLKDQGPRIDTPDDDIDFQ